MILGAPFEERVAVEDPVVVHRVLVEARDGSFVLVGVFGCRVESGERGHLDQIGRKANRDLSGEDLASQGVGGGAIAHDRVDGTGCAPNENR
jgi:hypothetical protein